MDSDYHFIPGLSIGVIEKSWSQESGNCSLAPLVVKYPKNIFQKNGNSTHLLLALVSAISKLVLQSRFSNYCVTLNVNIPSVTPRKLKTLENLKLILN